MNVLIRPPKFVMTADDFFEFVNRPENEARSLELVRGEVIEVSRPNRVHGRICVNVGYQLERYVRKQGRGYVVSNDTGVILERDPDTVRGPDVAYYDDVERFEDLPEKWGVTLPKLVVEVLSPNDLADYINRKITDYLQNGVSIVWVIDPNARTVTVYTAHDGPKLLAENEKLTGGEILPGFRCKVADFFFLPETPAKKPKRKRST
jgi:Uma2 family endonuclease